LQGIRTRQILFLTENKRAFALLFIAYQFLLFVQYPLI
jgi:hypothetical protein